MRSVLKDAVQHSPAATHLLAPVTAVAVLNEWVLFADGPICNIFSHRSSAIISSERVFAAQSIHGFALSVNHDASTTVLIWGGRLIKVVVLRIVDDQALVVEKSTVVDCLDWVLHASFAPKIVDTTNATAAIVTAHNSLVLLSVHSIDKETSSVSLRPSFVAGNLRCLLYTAHAKWLDQSRLLVASGTAFGEIVVWSFQHDVAASTTDTPSSSIVIHHNFTAHDGSIFGLDIAVNHTNSNYPSILLASCSDDRRIKVWIVPTKRHANAQRTNYPDTTPTGTALSTFATTWGHISRIWHTSFIPLEEHPQAQLRLSSFGEDATLQVWRLRSSVSTPDMTGTIENVGSYPLHAGKNIWSFAVNSASLKLPIVITGGADGALMEAYLPSAQAEAPEDLTKTIRPHTNISTYKSYTFTRSNTILVSTQSGEILVSVLDNVQSSIARAVGQDTISWQTLAQFDALRSYSISTSVSSAGVTFFADAHGGVYYYHDGIKKVRMLTQMDGKSAKLFAQQIHSGDNGQEPDAACAKQRLVLGVAKVGQDYMDLLHIEVMADGLSMTNTRQVCLEVGLIPTSMLHVLTPDGSEYLFVGDRVGRIFVKDLANTRAADTLFKAHNESVTCLTWIPGAAAGHGRGHILSASRDSSYCMHECHLDGRKLVTLCLNRTTLPFGPNIEGIKIRKSDSHVICWGFRSTSFVVYDETSQMELMQVDCGGSHRIWAFNEDDIDVGDCVANQRQCATFVWSKASKMQVMSSRKPPRRILKQGGHGREVKASTAHVKRCPDGDVNLLATGAEDTDIRIFTVGEGAGEQDSRALRCVSVLRKHTTGIQELEFSADARHLFSCGGREEFVIWRIRKTPITRIGVVCESTMPLENETSDLRIMGFETCQKGDLVDFDGSVSHESHQYVIRMVLSDSTLREYDYTLAAGQPSWTLTQQRSYLTSCLTQIQSLSTPTPTHSPPTTTITTTMGTDGHLCLWDLSNPRPRPLLRQKVHQSSIKCLVALALPPRAGAHRHLLVSGGDDNALALTILETQPSDPQHRPVASTLLLPRAHAAAVTAIAVLPAAPAASTHTMAAAEMTRIRLVTCSNDQRVKAWDVGVDGASAGVEGVAVARVADLFTPVADVASVAVLGLVSASTGSGAGYEVAVAVCGVGVEVKRFAAL